MDAVHWKKIQRVTPWLLPDDPPRSASTSSRTSRWSTSPSRWPASSAGRACRTASRWRSTRCSSGRRHWPRPTASSATHATASTTSASRTSPRTPRDLRLHPLLQLHRRLPQGRRPDEPDHAPAPDRRLRLRDRRPQQRPPPRERVRQEHRARTACSTRPTCCPTPTAASSIRAPCPSWLSSLPAILKALLRGKVTPKKALLPRRGCRRPKPVEAVLRQDRGRTSSATSSTSTSAGTRASRDTAKRPPLAGTRPEDANQPLEQSRPTPTEDG